MTNIDISNSLPLRMQERLQTRFDNADSDQNGSISFEEHQARAPDQVSAEKVETRFQKLDANGDGQVTLEEQQALAEERIDKMRQHSQGDSPVEEKGSRLTSMLQVMEGSDVLTQEQQSQVSEMLEQLSGDSDRSQRRAALDLINSILPSINTQA